jgi:hypothetical protein
LFQKLDQVSPATIRLEDTETPSPLNTNLTDPLVSPATIRLEDTETWATVAVFVACGLVSPAVSGHDN